MFVSSSLFELDCNGFKALAQSQEKGIPSVFTASQRIHLLIYRAASKKQQRRRSQSYLILYHSAGVNALQGPHYKMITIINIWIESGALGTAFFERWGVSGLSLRESLWRVFDVPVTHASILPVCGVPRHNSPWHGCVDSEGSRVGVSKTSRRDWVNWLTLPGKRRKEWR